MSFSEVELFIYTGTFIYCHTMTCFIRTFHCHYRILTLKFGSVAGQAFGHAQTMLENIKSY